jgi:hypothetical protein
VSPLPLLSGWIYGRLTAKEGTHKRLAQNFLIHGIFRHCGSMIFEDFM